MITVCKTVKPYSAFQKNGETEGIAPDVAPVLKISYFKRKIYSYYTHQSKDKNCLAKWEQKNSFEKPTTVAKFYMKTDQSAHTIYSWHMKFTTADIFKPL